MSVNIPTASMSNDSEFRDLFKGSLLAYLTGFYILAFYLELQLRWSILQTIRFQFTYGALIGALCLYQYINDPAKQMTTSGATKSAYWLLFILGVYTIFSMDRTESLTVFNDRAIKFSMLSFFIYCSVKNVNDLRIIIGFMILAWLKMGLEGFIGLYSGNLVWENQGIQRLHGSTSMTGHPNSFSGFAVGCLPFCIFLLMCVRSMLIRAALVLLIIFALMIVVNTGSRTGYVAVVAGAAYFFFKLKAGKFKIFLLAIATIVCTISFVPEQYKERFESIFTGEEKEGHSSAERVLIIEDAIALYKAHPFGVGVQAFPKVRNDMFGRSQNTHNLYLEVLTNTGPWGLIIFFVFVAKLIGANKQNIIDAEKLDELPTRDNQFLANLGRAVIGFLFLRLLLGLFGMDLYEIYWWLALGFALATRKLIFLQKRERQFATTLTSV